MTTFSGIAHVAIVVADMETSTQWYRRVLGFEPVGEVRPGPVELGRPRQMVRHAESGVTVAIHQPMDHSGGMFDPSRTGLDHFSLAVDGPAALGSWVLHFDEVGVPHSPVRDIGYAQFVTVDDPDGIVWELWAAAPAR
jgi:glyoxylase I family protein